MSTFSINRHDLLLFLYRIMQMMPSSSHTGVKPNVKGMPAIQPMCPPTRCLDATGGRASAPRQACFRGVLLETRESVNYPDEVIPSPRISPITRPRRHNRLTPLITYCSELLLGPRQPLSNVKIGGIQKIAKGRTMCNKD